VLIKKFNFWPGSGYGSGSWSRIIWKVGSGNNLFGSDTLLLKHLYLHEALQHKEGFLIFISTYTGVILNFEFECNQSWFRRIHFKFFPFFCGKQNFSKVGTVCEAQHLQTLRRLLLISFSFFSASKLSLLYCIYCIWFDYKRDRYGTCWHIAEKVGHVCSDCERDQLADSDSLHSVNSTDGFSDIFRRDQVIPVTQIINYNFCVCSGSGQHGSVTRVYRWERYRVGTYLFTRTAFYIEQITVESLAALNK